MSQSRFIFDLDGTLYHFKGGATFVTSEFYADIQRNVFTYFENQLKIPKNDVPETYDRLKRAYHSHVSLGVEREFGIDRTTYFENTWNVPPEKYIEKNDEAYTVLSRLQGRCAILTGAPRVWAQSALEYLNVYDFVNEMIFTGEPDIRKPSVEAFIQVGEAFGVPFDQIYSVGDQEESDIVMAQKAGMKTIRVGGNATSADFHITSIHELPDIVL